MLLLQRSTIDKRNQIMKKNEKWCLSTLVILWNLGHKPGRQKISKKKPNLLEKQGK